MPQEFYILRLYKPVYKQGMMKYFLEKAYYSSGVVGFFALLFCKTVMATPCTAAFPDGIQSRASTGGITFECGTQLLENLDNSLASDQVINPSPSCGEKTCGNVNCISSGIPAVDLNAGSFQESSKVGGDVIVSNFDDVTIGGSNNTITDYDDISIGLFGTLNFSPKPNGDTVYRIESLSIRLGGTVNFQPGDYWIEHLDIDSTLFSSFQVIGTGTVRIFVRGNLVAGTFLNWNGNKSASQLFIYCYESININGFSNFAEINGILYAAHDIEFDGVRLTGAINGHHVRLKDNSTVTFDSSAVANMDFGFICPPIQVVQFGVTTPSAGSFCQNMTITVRAQNPAGQTVPGYTGAITLDTQTNTGAWVSSSGGGAFSGGINNGVATYQFVPGDQGVVSFQLNYPASGATPVTVKVYQTNSQNIAGFSNPIIFSPAGLLITAVAVQNPPTPAPPAFSTPQISGANFSVFLTAYNPNGCGIISSYNGNRAIRFWTSYVDPSSGTLNATVNGTAIANAQTAPITTQNINFTNGVANITLNYADVGKLMLNAVDTAPSGPAGASGNFVVKPASFAIQIPNNAAQQVTTPAAAALSACLGNAIFQKAGQPFVVNVQPRNSQGNVTPNYGNESTHEGIVLRSSALVAPDPGRNGSNNDGVIANGSSFTKITSGGSPFGQVPYFTGSNFSFDEVGCIQLSASVASGSYLGAGDISSSLVVGRFIPHHFDAAGNAPQFATGCSNEVGSFTYLDKPFLYTTSPFLTVIARALAGTTTQNYTGSFWKLVSNSFGTAYHKVYTPVVASDTIPNLNLSASIPPPIFSDKGDGTGTFSFSDGGGLSIQRQSGSLVPPFTADIQLRITTITDADGVACTGTGCVEGGFAFGGTTPTGNGIAFNGTNGGKQFYQGRLRIIEANGSELLPLSVPLETQYYTTAGGFVLNDLDSCTGMGSPSVILLTPSFTNLETTKSFQPSSGNFQRGDNLNIRLTPPTVNGSTATGYFDIEADLSSSGANLPWLQYSWPYNGPTTSFNVNPRGRATFGIFRGSDQIIYEKEIFR